MTTTRDIEQQILDLVESSIEDTRVPDAIDAHADKLAETISIAAFTNAVTRAAHQRGMDVGTTCVIMGVARAAADMAPRNVDGSIDEKIANAMLRRAVSALAVTFKKEG